MSEDTGNTEENEQEFDVTAMSNDELIAIVSNHRRHDRKDVKAAADELDVRRTEQVPDDLVLTDLKGELQGTYKTPLVIAVVLMLPILVSLSYGYRTGTQTNWVYLLFGIAIGLTIAIIQLSNKRTYITFTANELIVKRFLNKPEHYAFDSMDSTITDSGRTLAFKVSGIEKKISLGPLNESTRKLFINTLTARLEKHQS